MTDSKTSWLGLELRNPFVLSASPLSKDIDTLKAAEDAGASAAVMHSLFEEQLTLEAERLNSSLFANTDSFSEALSYFPDLGEYELGPVEYLDHIRKAKDALEIPVIGSLNGVSKGGWTSYAKQIEEAGADALELNTYFIPTDPERSGASVEEDYVELVHEVASSVRIPVAVKVGSFFSSIPNIARRFEKAGAEGLVIFNRFYQPDFDVERLSVQPTLELSSSSELLLRIHWAALLHGRVGLDVAITGGVHTPVDIIKSMMAGANITMLASSLLRNGVGHVETLRRGVVEWMDAHEYGSLADMQGSLSQLKAAEPAAFERANYMKVLHGYSLR